MSDDEYEYDDMDNLMALLADDEVLNPYHDDNQSPAVKEYTPPSQNGLGQRSPQGSASEPSPRERSPQGPSQSAVGGSSCQSSLKSQRSSQGQAPSQDQRSSGCDKEETDETKSKAELMDELKQMREQVKLLQSQNSDGGSSQTSQPREMFSEAIATPVIPKRATKKKCSPAESEPSVGVLTKRHGAEKTGSTAGPTRMPVLSNLDDDDDEWLEGAEEEGQGKMVEVKSTLFGKNSKRVAHTPNNTAPRPDKVSPYKCELCKEVLDTSDALNFHMFQHRRESAHICPVCNASYPSKLKLEAHARTHKRSPPSAIPSTTTAVGRPAAGRPLGEAGQARGREEAGSGSQHPRRRKTNEHVETNKHSQIRILNPLVSSSRLDTMMEGRKMLRLSILQRYLSSGSNEGNWVTMGVIVSKLPPKTSSKGKRFSIWKLSDLTDCDQTVTLFLFGKAHEDHWKIAQGSVIGLLNASVMPPKDSGQDEGICLSIDHPEKMLLLGKSKDFGHCRARRKDGKACSMVVNTAVCEFCQYHVQTEYKKHSAKRADLQSSYGGVHPQAFKKKFGNNIIYGGHAYNPMSASVVGSSISKPGSSISKPGSKTKKKEGRLTLQSLGVKGAKEVEQEARDKVLTLHGRQNNEDTLVKVSGANEHFQEMLSCPSLGSQNLIRHMVKVEEVSKPVSSITAKDLIREHRETMKVRKASRLNGHKAASSSSSSSSVSKTTAGESGRRPTSSTDSKAGRGCPPQTDAENRAPVLGRGLQEDTDIIFDLSSPPRPLNPPWGSPPLPSGDGGKSRNLDEAKRRAIALVRAKGRIAKDDPNRVAGSKKGSLSPRKREALKRRVEEDLNRSIGEDSESDSQQPAKKKQKKYFLGQEVIMSPEELQTIREAKSSHSGLLAEVQSEIEELYFQQLEKKERLENQMDSIKEKKCKVVSCKQCDYTWFSPSKLCTSENHPLTRHEATMRYFKCKNCSSRCITFNRIPNKSCRSCGSTSYERASMLKERKGPVLDSERLLIRGEERKWVM